MWHQTMEVSDRLGWITRANVVHVRHGVLVAIILSIVIVIIVITITIIIISIIIIVIILHHLTNVSFPISIGVELIRIWNQDAVIINIRNALDSD